MIDSVHTRYLNDEPDTLALGRAVAAALQPGLVVHLAGDLGAGKTTLTRGILARLGFQGKVKSPTYTLVEPYKVSKLDFYHFDLYRLKDELEWHDAGFSEYFDTRSVAVVEWAEKAPHLVPPADLRITLRVAGAGRDAFIEGLTVAGRQCLDEIRQRLAGDDPRR